MTTNKATVFDALKKLSFAKGQAQTEERLTIYVEILAKFKTEDVLKCITYFLLREKFFPDISELVNYLDPKPQPKDIAMSCAGIIQDASRRIGQYEHKKAERVLGPYVWDVVKSFGGWMAICQSNFDGVFKAQLRDCALSRMTMFPNSKQEIYKACISFDDEKMEKTLEICNQEDEVKRIERITEDQKELERLKDGYFKNLLEKLGDDTCVEKQNSN